MAEDDDSDRSQDPTQKRLDEAIERGDVAKSQEVNTWFILGAATLILMSFSMPLGATLETTMRGLVANAHSLRVDGTGLLRLCEKLEFEVIGALGMPLLLLTLAALVGNVIQHRLVWSVEALTPKLSKVSPLAGAKRMFSKQALANFAKGLVKLALVGAIMTSVLWPQRHRLDGLVATDPSALLALTRSLSLSMLGSVVAVLAIVAALDYLFQYRQWYEKQKMSLRELKQEFKQSEGDPAIKAKIRQLRNARSRKRMMAAVPTSSVVITNPTHFAVALKYELGMTAPICVAKGIDAIALKIREAAGNAKVPVVENPALARALHASVDIDQEVPPEHYKAVAEVISYVIRLNRAFAR